MRNIELKTRCLDPEMVLGRALALAARDEGTLTQEDTFFAAPDGRLKLRDFGDGSGELIAYRRPNAEEARASDYLIHQTLQPDVLRNVLSHALPVVGVVRKIRRLLLLDHTRIHLDQVEGLGSYAELETVLSGIDEAEGRTELTRIASGLGLDREEPVATAYIDLLRETGG